MHPDRSEAGPNGTKSHMAGSLPKESEHYKTERVEMRKETEEARQRTLIREKVSLWLQKLMHK
jgi:hypothetical protein